MVFVVEINNSRFQVIVKLKFKKVLKGGWEFLQLAALAPCVNSLDLSSFFGAGLSWINLSTRLSESCH